MVESGEISPADSDDEIRIGTDGLKTGDWASADDAVGTQALLLRLSSRHAAVDAA